jgi:hypothetical protein
MATPQINIMAFVDVIGALATGTLTGNIFMTDNSRAGHTTGRGTATLSSAVTNGQVINWHVVPVDVQTSVEIVSITFQDPSPCALLRKYGAPSGDYWAGYVGHLSTATDPTPPQMTPGMYRYVMKLDMGRKVMTMDVPASINVIAYP